MIKRGFKSITAILILIVIAFAAPMLYAQNIGTAYENGITPVPGDCAVYLANSGNHYPLQDTGECGPDSPPSSANAMDDEFNTGSSINLSKWTWMNQNGGSDAISDGYLITTLQPFNGYLIQGFTQATPSAPYGFEAKVTAPILSQNATVTALGLGLYETSSTKAAYFWFENPNETNKIPATDAQSWTGNTFGSAITPLTQSYASQEYLKMVDDGTYVFYESSVDGRAFTSLGTGLVSNLFTTSPNETGIFFLNNGTGGFTTSYGVDFFRELNVTSSTTTDTFPNSGDLNNYSSQPTALPNGWSIASNTLSNTASGQATLYLAGASLSKGSVSSKVQFSITTAGPYAGVSLGINTSTGSRYAVILVPGASGALSLYQFTSWTASTLLTSVAWTADTAQHTLAVVSTGTNLDVYLDGVEKIEWGVSAVSGAVGIDNFDGHASYQNFSYTVDSW